MLTPNEANASRSKLSASAVFGHTLGCALGGWTGPAAVWRFDAHRLAGFEYEPRHLRRQHLFVGPVGVAHQPIRFAPFPAEHALGLCQMRVAAAAKHRAVF